MTLKHTSLHDFFRRQLGVWPDARQRFNDLQQVQTREAHFGNAVVMLQHNPGRMLSTNADMAKALRGERPCFLCSHNRPDIQVAEDFANDFEILINPYPILSEHYTIALRTHTPQMILAPLPHNDSAFHALLKWTEDYPQHTIIYNGPRAGASAPDHLHLQAGDGSRLPLLTRWHSLRQQLQHVTTMPHGTALFRLHGHCANAFAMTFSNNEEAQHVFSTLYLAMQQALGTQEEPPMNIVAWHGDEKWVCIFPRKAHRPACFFATDESPRLISPGALDMAGQMTVPRHDDYISLTDDEVAHIYADVCVDDDTMRRIGEKLSALLQPTISVGLMTAQRITVCFHDPYSYADGTMQGQHTIEMKDGMLCCKGKKYHQLRFAPKTDKGTFTLDDVTIGIHFHWQRNEPQTFEDELLLSADETGEMEVVNRLPIERYLVSVISSEMSADAPLELLKAHAVISRSWVLRMMQRYRQSVHPAPCHEERTVMDDGTPCLLRWYDAEGHSRFDVCADDHCQRYQGIRRTTNANAEKAVADTSGMVLAYNDEICDARYAKCCGGTTETFDTCWEDMPVPYLTPVTCPYCHHADITTMLNAYDRETQDFYRWEVVYSQEELTQLVDNNLHIDLGLIEDLVPLRRGASGRISLLKIVGQHGSLVVGKELEIRRMLSDSHLLSSNFTVERTNGDIPTATRFTLHGNGWGHGVGLCQIGAANMATKGFTYEEILHHYYKGTTIKKYF